MTASDLPYSPRPPRPPLTAPTSDLSCKHLSYLGNFKAARTSKAPPKRQKTKDKTHTVRGFRDFLHAKQALNAQAAVDKAFENVEEAAAKAKDLAIASAFKAIFEATNVSAMATAAALNVYEAGKVSLPAASAAARAAIKKAKHSVAAAAAAAAAADAADAANAAHATASTGTASDKEHSPPHDPEDPEKYAFYNTDSFTDNTWDFCYARSSQSSDSQPDLSLARLNGAPGPPNLPCRHRRDARPDLGPIPRPHRSYEGGDNGAWQGNDLQLFREAVSLLFRSSGLQHSSRYELHTYRCPTDPKPAHDKTSTAPRPSTDHPDRPHDRPPTATRPQQHGTTTAPRQHHEHTMTTPRPPPDHVRPKPALDQR